MGPLLRPVCARERESACESPCEMGGEGEVFVCVCARAGNVIKDEGATDLAAPLGSNRTVKQLYLNGEWKPALPWS